MQFYEFAKICAVLFVYIARCRLEGGVRPVMQIDNAINIHWIRSGETVESFDPAEEATLLVSLPPTTGFFYHAVVLVLEHDKENL